jgi:hypothetical protein
VARAGRWGGSVGETAKEDLRQRLAVTTQVKSSQDKSSAVVTSGDASVNDSSRLHVYVSVRHWYRYIEYLFCEIN